MRFWNRLLRQVGHRSRRPVATPLSLELLESREVLSRPPAGLTNWWPWNSNPRDIIARRDATLHGSATYAPGQVHGALTLDGSGSGSVAHDPSFNLGVGDFTFSFWARLNTLVGEQVLIEQYVETNGPTRSGWSFTKMVDNRLRLALPGMVDIDTPALDLPTNTWLHYAIRRSGNTFSLFNNGTLLGSGTASVNLDSPASLKFGHRGSPTDTPGSVDSRGFYLRGGLDEIELYRGTALSDSEIESIRQTGTSGHSVDVFTTAAAMLDNRGLDYQFTLTVLMDGRVLAVGGEGSSTRLASAELFDPASNTWTRTGSLNVARAGHSATLLPDGKVLISGGVSNGTSQLTSAELFDPETGLWTLTGSLADARSNHTSLLLHNGMVLVAAGGRAGPGDTFGLASAELYDPETGTWNRTGSLNIARMGHGSTLLHDGRVLLAGGQDRGVTFSNFASAEIYDVETGMWTRTGDMAVARRGAFQLTTLDDGRVLVAGGGTNWTAIATAQAEIFDPVAGVWAHTSPMPATRQAYAATLLHDGTVLVSAGNEHPVDFGPGTYLTSSLLFDPATETWKPTANSLAGLRANHRQVLLPDGSVLVVGGSTGAFSIATAERYGPANYAPYARAGDPYFVTEGSRIVLDGWGSTDSEQPTDTLVFQWDLNNNGIFGEVGAAATSGDEIGPTPTYIATNADGPALETVTLRVFDGNGLVSMDTTTIDIANAPPVITSLSNSSAAIGGVVEGQQVTVTGRFTDAGRQDTHTATVDWGDGTTSDAVIREVNGTGTLSARHVYLAGGTYRIKVTLNDDDEASVTQETEAVIAGGGIQDGVLNVIGTSRADRVQVSAQAGGLFRLYANFLPTGSKTLSASGVQRIVVRLGGGDDQATLTGNIAVPALLDGGAGNDLLQGSNGASCILLGGTGNDTLIGGASRDLLIGGAGADSLRGNGNEDLLVGGTTSYDGRTTALDQIRVAWNRTDRTYAQRIAELTNGVGMNGGIRLTRDTVFDDRAVDNMLGDAGTDWFFASVTGLIRDVLSDRTRFENVVDLA